MRRFFRGISFYLLIFIVILLVVEFMGRDVEKPIEIDYTQFVEEVKNNNVETVTFVDSNVRGTFKDGTEFNLYLPKQFDVSKHIDPLVEEGKIRVIGEPVPQTPWYLQMLPTIFIILIFVVFWFVFMQQSQGGGNRVMSFGKSKAKLHKDESAKKITFEDVASFEEEKEELVEIVDFLKSPKKFIELGARIPKGVLMVGPPGTGKTYLSKAVAGEAGVPFFSISGSDFVEMFVGVGASRVRDLFENAKKSSPCIVFIDEIDAVGRRRGAGLGGGHDEREQTLNQLLVEMDGFSENEGIIIIAATNRPDILDPALLRPGRFDRQVHVGIPDIKGREEILKVHTREKPLDDDIDLKVIAKRTIGFTPADLENVLNEAALLSAREDLKKIPMRLIEEAITKVVAGPEKRSKVRSEKENKITAYHEAGHAVVTRLLPNADPVHMVTIMPRGGAGGFTMHLPQEDRSYLSKILMEEHIVMLLGGRIAEKLVLDDISTGASDDIERATKMARSMVTNYGMSEKLGPMTYGEDDNEVFIGRNIGRSRNYSEEIAAEIDKEVRRIISEAYQRAEKLLSDNIDKLERVAKALLKKETLDANEFEAVFLNEDNIDKNSLDIDELPEVDVVDFDNKDDSNEE